MSITKGAAGAASILTRPQQPSAMGSASSVNSCGNAELPATGKRSPSAPTATLLAGGDHTNVGCPGPAMSSRPQEPALLACSSALPSLAPAPRVSSPGSAAGTLVIGGKPLGQAGQQLLRGGGGSGSG